MHVSMHIKHVQARIDIAKYNKLKKMAGAEDKSINALIADALDEYTERHAAIDPEDVLFTSAKFDFEEEDLSERHAEHRFAGA